MEETTKSALPALSKHPAEWEAFARELGTARGTVCVLGATDTGKTTLCSYLLRALCDRGLRVAYLDADLGQSTLGPPATLSLAIYSGSSPALPLYGILPHRMVFIGATSPEGHLLATTVGVWRLVEEARSAGSEVLLVDTSGLVYGGAARELKFQKIRLLRPDYLAALQRGGEVEHLLLPHERSGVRVVRLPVSDQALRHSREQRQAFRQRRFREYFRGARGLEIALDRVGVYGLPLGSGTRMDFRELNRLSRMLDALVIYGERSPDVLFLVVEGGCGRDRIFSVKEEFGVREVLVVERTDLQSLLLGLNDSRQFTLGLGILQEIDFRAGRLRVVTPLPHLGEVSQIAFGSLRVDPSGTELGKV